ncbi:MAG: EscU/YscU/HrcU family type III secretion system export apparatus switch protein [Planctomycetaceae bacterium]|nr:EscU/YscU/HrcU family type III secretion system export apparatus switch protein [Planctomycetaceae bacterium]
MADENGDKKHDATPKRLQDAREKGQVAKSQDLAAALVLLLAIILIMTLGQYLVTELFEYSRSMLLDPTHIIAENEEPGSLKQSVLSLFRATIIRFMMPLSIFFIVLLLTAIVSNLAQIGFLWLPDKAKIDFTHLDPMKGFKRMFSMQSLVRLLMGLLKIAICGAVAWYTVEGSIGGILHASETETNQIASFLAWTLLMVALKVAVALVIIALLDLMYQRWKHAQDLKMTDQEIRDEYKNYEGNPEVRQKRRQLQQEMARKQRVQGTPEADVVVTNPTHFAVGVKFDAKTMHYPIVVSKGADHLAFQIRKIAAEHDIPVIERKALARALFEKIEIGQSVYPLMPPEHITMLAEVMAEAYRLTGRHVDDPRRRSA